MAPTTPERQNCRTCRPCCPACRSSNVLQFGWDPAFTRDGLYIECQNCGLTSAGLSVKDTVAQWCCAGGGLGRDACPMVRLVDSEPA